MPFVTFPGIIEENAKNKTYSIAEQQRRLEALEELYASPDYEPVDESKITDFDLDTAYAEGVKFNEVSFIASHNSYQTECVPSFKKLMSDISTVTFGLVGTEKYNYNSDALTQQFNLGIRSVELDIETVISDGRAEFVCSHTPIIDTPSNCYSFSGALREIKMWSDANPGHLPITVIVEPKKVFLPEKGMRFFNLEYANELDLLLRETFGEKLLTPAGVMGGYGSLKEMREADGWPQLKDCSGKVMFLLHDTTVTEKYIAQDKTIKTQAMFPMLRYDDRDRDCASFLLVNKPGEALKYSAELAEKKLIFRTQVDTYGSYNDSDTQKASDSRANILSTDYPPKADMTNVYRCVSFEGKCTAGLK